MREDPDMASAVAAIRTLLEFLKRNKGLSRLAGGASNLMSQRFKNSPRLTFDKLRLPPPPPSRRNYSGPAGEPDVGHRVPDRSGLLRGRVVRRRALPALHQPHVSGASGERLCSVWSPALNHIEPSATSCLSSHLFGMHSSQAHP